MQKSGREKKEIEDRIKGTMAALTAAEADLDGVRDKRKETKTAMDRKTKSIQSVRISLVHAGTLESGTRVLISRSIH